MIVFILKLERSYQNDMTIMYFLFHDINKKHDVDAFVRAIQNFSPPCTPKSHDVFHNDEHHFHYWYHHDCIVFFDQNL